jgi:aquaporin Z
VRIAVLGTVQEGYWCPESNNGADKLLNRRRSVTALNRKLVVEFIGTFFLVFTVGTATAKLNPTGPIAPLAIGSVLMVMVFAGGYISGGHYNPAVSTGAMVRGKLTQQEWVAYIVTQLVAGVIGGLFASIVAGHQHAGPLGGTGKVLLAELLFTFALVWVVLNVATAKGQEGNSFFGLAIGFTVLAGAFAVGAISGGAFNPAVALGQIVHGAVGFSNIWKYWLAQFIAGAVAGWVFLMISEPEAAVRPPRPEPPLPPRPGVP